MTSFVDSGDGEHIFYLGTDQHIHQLYFNTGVGHWVDQDLTITSGAAVNAQNQSPLASFVDTPGEHVSYIGTNNHVIQLYWTSSGGWVEQDLSATAENGLTTLPGSESPLIGFFDSIGEHFYYLARPEGSAYDIMELCFCGSGIWTLQDPTEHATGGASHQALIGSQITIPSSGTYNLRWKNGTP